MQDDFYALFLTNFSYVLQIHIFSFSKFNNMQQKHCFKFLKNNVINGPAVVNLSYIVNTKF